MQTSYVTADQSPKMENSMNRTKCAAIGFTLGAALLGALTGCIGYSDGHHHSGGYGYSETHYVQDDYVYYPGYQVYYGNNSHNYVYQEGRNWVTRPSPPRVSPNVLVVAPSVRLDFHDAPANHHAEVVKQYPKHWAPPQSSHGNDEGNKKDKREGN